MSYGCVWLFICQVVPLCFQFEERIFGFDNCHVPSSSDCARTEIADALAWVNGMAWWVKRKRDACCGNSDLIGIKLKGSAT